MFYIIFTNELPEVIHNCQTLSDNIPNNSSQETENDDHEDIHHISCEDCGTLACFADDSTVSFSSPSIVEVSEHLSSKFQDVSKFMNNNKLKLNSDKTHFMIFTSDYNWRNKLDDIKENIFLDTGYEQIPISDSENLLGGKINKNLKWTEHILFGKDSLVKKLNLRLGALKRISKVASFKTRLMVANGTFMSKLIYLAPLWGGCEKYLIKTLQIVQNRTARVITNSGPYTPISQMLDQCGWLSVNQLVFFHTVLLLYKTRTNQQPKALFKMQNSQFSYRTRAADTDRIRMDADYLVRNEINARSYRWRSIRSWNMLPPELTSISNLGKFKSRLKEWTRRNISI